MRRRLNEKSNGLLIFDAYPLIAALRDEPASHAVAALLDVPDRAKAVSSINAAEVIATVARLAGTRSDAVADELELWLDAGLRVVPLTWQSARDAAAIRTAHYHRSRSPVSLADCAAIALAAEVGGTLVSSDPPMLRIARNLGIEVHPVRDSAGHAH